MAIWPKLLHGYGEVPSYIW